MNGKKGSYQYHVEINIQKQSMETPKQKKESSSAFASCQVWMRSVWDFAKEDSYNRVKFSFKVALAILLVSLLILVRAPYDIFGTNIIWSILTVAVMFEYNVGATFNRGFNRTLGSLLAGILALVVGQLALRSGRIAEPIIIGLSIFFVGAITSFMKQWPSLVPYEYGFRVVLFTYCLIIVSGYRMGNPIRTAIDRLYSIAIGGLVALLVNVLVLPIWAGDQLHKVLVDSFNAVADSLEECVEKYLEDEGLEHPEFTSTVMDEFPDEPAYKKCRTILNSSAKLESLANSAKWEPPHGRFTQFFYPWSEYVKVGAVLRYCAYEVMALHGVLHSEIQAPYNLRVTFKPEIQEAVTRSVELIRNMGDEINNMKRSLQTSVLNMVHISAERLQSAIDLHSYLLIQSNFDPKTATSTASMDDISSQIPINSNQLDKLSQKATATVEMDDDEMVRKQSRRMHSWPSREGGGFDDDVVTQSLSHGTKSPRMRALESTTTLSLATFTSLIIEFVARLDHLVEAVDELSSMASFKHEDVV